uniref:Uncharacterized protein n=1 Tax=Oryza glumipatula TaxID=40148 RepID=A0A0D9Z8M0_9ORYZ
FVRPPPPPPPPSIPIHRARERAGGAVVRPAASAASWRAHPPPPPPAPIPTHRARARASRVAVVRPAASAASILVTGSITRARSIRIRRNSFVVLWGWTVL